jgi:GTP-binding protein HflX
MSVERENEVRRERAILVSVDTGEFDVETSLDELEELARTAGAEVLAVVSQKREGFDRATVIGKGKLSEIREFAEANEADLLIFDQELSGSRMRNIADATGLPVVDRTTLILDIFAQRAHTHEGRLQVELAQQRYRLTRLIGEGKALSRLGGGIGTRGPGETKLEQDRRHIRRRIATLEAQLGKLEQHRIRLRAKRARDGIKAVAIVGYTNVGKSTLLNRLSDADVLAEDKLFATLDPTARALRLPGGRSVMLVDTVGLVRRLPHGLVRAFHSTLEEAAGADLLICLCDASSPEADEQIAVTKDLMAELGAAATPMLVVLNKSDLLAAAGAAPPVFGADVMISARTGDGIDRLLAKIESSLPPSQTKETLLIPYSEGDLVAKIRESGQILSEDYEEDGVRLTALVDTRLRRRTKEFHEA